MNIKPIAQSLLRQNYNLTHSYHRLRLYLQNLKTKEKIVIYQMGKVGSSSIWNSLKSLNLGIPIYHVHGLEHQQVSTELGKSKKRFSKLRTISYETLHAEYLRHQIDAENFIKPWKVITIVREPVSQVLSSFFQGLEQEIKLGFDYRKKVKTDSYKKVITEIIQRFEEKYIDNENFLHPYTWFDREIKSNFGIDIFANLPFEQANYAIYTGDRANILLLKLETLNDFCEIAFQEFLEIDNFKLIKTNVGTQKRYGKFYKDFLSRIDLPRDYLDKMYRSNLMKTFYSDSEIEKFYQYWKRS